MKPKAAPDHLVEQPGGHRGTQQCHAVDVGRVEAGRQHIDVTEVLERLPIKQA